MLAMMLHLTQVRQHHLPTSEASSCPATAHRLQQQQMQLQQVQQLQQAAAGSSVTHHCNGNYT